ncbi:MAG: hypothetical protein AAB897_01665 [Patescibacteria group bacterium]|mgnify:CR=1 FL=1
MKKEAIEQENSESPSHEDPRQILLEEAKQLALSDKEVFNAAREELSKPLGPNEWGYGRREWLEAEEEREANMIKFLDLVELSLMELRDSQTFKAPGPQVYSEKTEQKIEEIASKIIWAIDKYYGDSKEPILAHDRSYETLQYAKKIDQARTPQEKLILINDVLHFLHLGGPAAQYLVKDLYNLHGAKVKNLLDRLSNLK